MSDAKPVLTVVVASVRDGRKGRAVADWFVGQAEKHGKFAVQLADLKELDLPLMTEPNHPRQKQYTQEKTWEWSRLIEGSDAFTFVMPEYNFSPTAPLINALDYLYQEWNNKAALLVSYGGISGGMRAAQQLKLTLNTLQMMVSPNGVVLPSFTDHINESGEFVGYDAANESAQAQLDDLLKWDSALRTLRGK